MSQSEYEQDAQRRLELHNDFWAQEPLTAWQEFILCRELDCSRKRRFTRGPSLTFEEATA